MDDDANRRRIAYHEAAHAVVASIVGRRVIAARATLSHTELEPRPTRVEPDEARLGPFAPATIRERIERDVLIAYAGDEGERLVGIEPTGYVVPEGRDPSDNDQAEAGAEIVVGYEEAGAYLAWLRVATRRLVRQHAFEIAAVGEALLREGELDGAAVEALMAQARKEQNPDA